MQPGSCLVLDLVLLIMLAGCQLVIYRYPPHIFGVGGWVLGVLCITLCITQKRLLMMMMMITQKPCITAAVSPQNSA